MTVGKKVIPLYRKTGQMWISDIKLPELLLSNSGTTPVTPIEMRIAGLSGGTQLAEYTVCESLLNDILKQTNPQFRALFGTDVLQAVFDHRLATGFGEVQFHGTRLSEAPTLGKSESEIILLSRVLHVHYTGLTKVDALRIAVTVRQDGRSRVVHCPLNFMPYQAKGKYIFPLEGDLCLVNLPTNTGMHRKCMSQEFAIDVLCSAPLKDGRLRSARTNGPQALTDYLVFGRPVRAVGSGVVVEAVTTYPDAVQGNPAALSLKDVDALIEKMEPQVGFTAAVMGNHLIIDHENGEFSLYAHLREGSLKCRSGDRVQQGEVVAAVGNTGHSNEPHLHFQLMDSKDPWRANSLPVSFVDLLPANMDQLCTEANTPFASDYVMVHVGQ